LTSSKKYKNIGVSYAHSYGIISLNFASWNFTYRPKRKGFVEQFNFTIMTNEIQGVILTTPEQLQMLIADAVDKVAEKLANKERTKSEAREMARQRDGLTIGETVEFLAELGVPTTIKSLYARVYLDKIPYRKVGRRLIFSRKELTQWVEEQTTHPQDKKSAAALRLAASANRNSR